MINFAVSFRSKEWSRIAGCPRWIRNTTSRSRIWRANRYTMEQFVMREGLEPTTGCFVDSCSDPTELPHQFAEAEGFALDLWSLCPQRTSGTWRFSTFLLWQASPSSPSEQCAALDLSAILPSSFRVQRYNRLMKPFFVAEKKYIKNSFLQKNKNKRIAIQNKIPTSC